MKNTLTIKQPSAFFGAPWKEATPLGNGLTGALMYGGTATEQIVFHRYDCWHNAVFCDIPDVSECFTQMRETMDADNYFDARDMLCQKLRQNNYFPDDGTPFPLGTLRIDTAADGLFKNYKRCLHMDKAISCIAYEENGSCIKRESFISRSDDIFVSHITSVKEKNYSISLNYHNDNTENTGKFFEKIKDSFSVEYTDETIVLKAKNGEINYAVVVFVPGAKNKGGKLQIFADCFAVYAKCVSGRSELDIEKALSVLKQSSLCDFETLLEKHLSLHIPLYNSAELDISNETSKTNEQLLEDAYENEASSQLLEKLWKFGRYLFICGTHKDGIPFPLYGLWAGEYNAPWAQYVCNENVEISYWHALCGNLTELVKPLIRFFCAHMDTYRAAAKKLFGCDGIFVSVYSSPLNTEPFPVVPVIIHYLSCAGWLCSHFYDYYRATNDKEYLEKYILPFMRESARFYLDYAKYDDGKMCLYPSVSPENTPENFMGDDRAMHMAHPMPTTRNATMDFGILKELLTNLIVLSEEGCDVTKEEVSEWKNALLAIPEYMTNEKGAVCEWMDGRFEDNYLHRHLSHIYPLFPGHEITKDSPLFPAFKKAVDLRILGAQSGWSLAHMSGIYCAMGEGEKAIECLDILSKSCLLDNFFTLHNDFRYTGLTLDMGYLAPVQLDASLGAVNAVQMMVFQANGGRISLLPALPERLSRGTVKGFAFDSGSCNIEWDIEKGVFYAVLEIRRDSDLSICLPEMLKNAKVMLNGEQVSGHELAVKAEDVVEVII